MSIFLFFSNIRQIVRSVAICDVIPSSYVCSQWPCCSSGTFISISFCDGLGNFFGTRCVQMLFSVCFWNPMNPLAQSSVWDSAFWWPTEHFRLLHLSCCEVSCSLGPWADWSCFPFTEAPWRLTGVCGAEKVLNWMVPAHWTQQCGVYFFVVCLYTTCLIIESLNYFFCHDNRRITGFSRHRECNPCISKKNPSLCQTC